jgi:small ubiquitin-related modifier
MSTPASVEAGKAGATRALLEEFVTLVVTDQEGRRLTRTMRRSDQMQVLMDFYSMVPTVEQGKGFFKYGGMRISGEGTSTPSKYRMKDGEEILYFPELDLVTPVLRDFAGRSFTRTMRTTDRLQVLLDFYHAMVSAAAWEPLVLLYCGERVAGEQTPAGIGMKDWDRIYVVPTLRFEVGQEKQPHAYNTIKVKDQNGNKVYRTMWRTQKLEVLIDLFCATVLDAEGVSIFERVRFLFDGHILRPERTPHW